MSFLANKYVIYAAVLLSLVVGFRLWLGIHDHTLTKDAQAAQDAAIAASVAEGQQREAKKWIAAYTASQEAQKHVDESVKGYQATNDELLRRIDRMRHNQVHASTLPGPNRDPQGTDIDSEGTGLLSTALAEVATECSLDYATVATKLQALDQLTLKSSPVAH